jgi:hypothetical protein
MKKNIVSVVMFIGLIFIFCACHNAKRNGNDVETNTESNENIELTEYEKNKVLFSVPSSWNLTSGKSQELMTFRIGENNKNVAIIRSEDIPEIMKIDAGGDYISDKYSVVNYYGISTNDSYDVTNEQWKKDYGFEYCDIEFDCVGRLDTGEKDSRLGRCVVIPINETERVFLLMIVSYNKSDLESVDVILSNIKLGASEENLHENEIEETTTSLGLSTYETYTKMINLNVDDDNIAVYLNQYYYYRNEDSRIPLLSEDIEWINNSLNKDKTIEQSALYRKLATLLEGYEVGFNNGQDYADFIFDDVPSSKSELKRELNRISKFFTTKNYFQSIIKALKKCQSVEGEYKIDSNVRKCKVNFTIISCKKCAEELGISEECLGYMLAALEDYAPKTSFDGDTYKCKYTPY